MGVYYKAIVRLSLSLQYQPSNKKQVKIAHPVTERVMIDGLSKITACGQRKRYVRLNLYFPSVVSFLKEDIIRISDHLLFIVDVIPDAHQRRLISVPLSSDNLQIDTQ